MASIFQIGISRNTKCALKDGFRNPVTYAQLHMHVQVNPVKTRTVVLLKTAYYGFEHCSKMQLYNLNYTQW